MLYVNEDYRIRSEVVNGEEIYFLQFINQAENTPELQIDYQTYLLYRNNFSKPLRKHKNERSRHLEIKSIDDLIASGEFVGLEPDIEEQYATKSELEEVVNIVKSCTPIQQKRFWLHYLHGLNFREIARVENCDEAAVRQSINSVSKKIKIFKNR